MIPADCAVIEPCCERTYMLSHDVATAVADALRNCLPDGECEDLDVFVSHNEPVGTGHYVAAWMVRERYSDRLHIPLPTISVRYVEGGFPRPTTKGGRFNMPSGEAVDAAARHSYSHGDVMVDAVRSGVNTNAPHWRGCRNVQIDQRIPDRVQAGWSGWTVTATWGL